MGPQSRIEFSRVVGPWALGVLGTAVALTMSVLVGENAVFESAGTNAPAIVAVGAVLLLPVVLCLVSRVSESSDASTIYSAVREDGGSLRLFATGWLSIGGYLAIAALTIQAVSGRVDGLLESVLSRDVPGISIVAPATAVAVISLIVAPVERLRTRALLAGLALVAFGGLLVRVLLVHGDALTAAELPVLDAPHMLSAAALLGGALWFVDVTLDYRRIYRRSDGSLALLNGVAWGMATIVMVAVAILMRQEPGLVERLRGVPDVTFSRDGVRVAGFVVTLLLCWIVAAKAFGRLLRLAGAMARDGSIPSLFEDVDDGERTPLAFLLLFGTLAGVLALLAPVRVLIGVAAVTLLWAAAIAFASRLRRGRPDPKPAFALPLHPLFPAVALAVCAFFSVIVPGPGALVTAGWLLVGVGVRVAYRRGADELGGAPEIEPADDEEAPLPDAESVYRVLVCPGPAGDAARLIRLGADLARARGGDVVVLRVAALLERLPRSEVRRIARREWRALRTTIQESLGDAPDVHAIVRIANSESGGIVDAAATHQADLVLLDRPARHGSRAEEHQAIVDAVFAGTSSAVALLHGDVPDEVERVVAAVADGPDTPHVLAVGDALAKGRGGTLSALSVIGRSRARDEAEAEVARLCEEVGVQAEPLIAEDDDPATGIVRAAGDKDVIVMGTTRDRALAHAGTSGMWRDVADRAAGAAILVRRAEKGRVGWVREAWHVAFSTLPTLTVGERAEVYSQMRHAARAGVDFYVLIVVSAALATFGLFQDSAAVVIGAMLVAPLMSPIVAISQGIVQGNVSMIRRGLASTLKGTLVAIVVAAFFTLAMPAAPPTAQVLARTEPTLLDLGVGLAAGAAAAYGISRQSVSAALPGVAIAVALVPPLCVVGFGLGADRLDIATGASLLYVTNLTAIVFVAAVVFLLLGFYPRQRERRRAVRGAVLTSIVGVLLLSVPLAASSWETSRVGQLELFVESSFRDEVAERGLDLGTVVVDRVDGAFVVHATLYAPPEFEKDELAAFLAEVERETATDVRLDIRLVRAERVLQEDAR